jgi:hypothetical protein
VKKSPIRGPFLTLHGVVFDIFVLPHPGTAEATPGRVRDTLSQARPIA